MKVLVLLFSLITSIAQIAEAAIIKTKKVHASHVESAAENCSTGPIREGGHNDRS